MKLILLSTVAALSFAAPKGCQKGTVPAATEVCFKGRLEIAALCMNYTIKVLEGPMDTSKIEASWTDESTGNRYENVFRLESVCNFPANLKAGDEFYFTIDKGGKKQDCAVCMAYYPTPKKALPIVVSTQPCK